MEPVANRVQSLRSGDNDERMPTGANLSGEELVGAWRQIHSHLIHAVTTARQAIAAKKVQRRFWMEELCANLTDDGMLVTSSVWNRPPKDVASSRSTTHRKRKINSTNTSISSTKKSKIEEEEDDDDDEINKFSSPPSTAPKRIRLKLAIHGDRSESEDESEDDDEGEEVQEEEEEEDGDDDDDDDDEEEKEDRQEEKSNRIKAVNQVQGKKLIVNAAADDDESPSEEEEEEEEKGNDYHETSSDRHGTPYRSSPHERLPTSLHSHYPHGQDYQDYPGHRPPSHWVGGPPPRHPYGHVSGYASSPVPPYDYPPSYHHQYGGPPQPHHPSDQYGGYYQGGPPPPPVTLPHYPRPLVFSRDGGGDSDEESDGGPTF